MHGQSLKTATVNKHLKGISVFNEQQREFSIGNQKQLWKSETVEWNVYFDFLNRKYIVPELLL